MKALDCGRKLARFLWHRLKFDPNSEIEAGPTCEPVSDPPECARPRAHSNRLPAHTRTISTPEIGFKTPFNPEVFAKEEAKLKRKKLAPPPKPYGVPELPTRAPTMKTNNFHG